MNIFPFTDPKEYIEEMEISKEVPLAKEWAWDFTKNEFKLRNGKMYLVEKNEAVKIWIYKILKTERFKYLAYDHDYGHDLKTFIGYTGSQGYIKSEVKRVVEEAILSTLSDYIEKLYDFKIDILDDLVCIYFKASTIYDEEVEIDGFTLYRQN